MKVPFPFPSLALLLMSSMAAAAADFHFIETVTSATQGTDLYQPEGLIQGPDIGFESTAPFNRLAGGASGLWVTDATNGGTGQYFDPLPDPAPKLVFDLGSDVSLAEISVWAYATGIEGNSLKDFTLRFATDAEGPEAAGTSITFSPSFSATPQLPGRQSFMFGQRLSARYVEMTPLSNNVGLGPGGDRVGFGETAFEALPLVAGSSVDLPPAVQVGLTSFLRTFDVPVRNTGESALTLTDPVLAGDAASAFSIVSVPSPIPPYSSRMIQMQFNPVGLAEGDYSATLRLSTNTVGMTVVESTLSASVPAEPADEFYPVAGATSTTDETDFYKAGGLIGGPGIGFDAEQPHTQPLSAATWVTNDPNGGAGDYFEPLPEPAPVLVLDLGQNVPLGEISVWGYSPTNANGASQFSLRFATEAEGAAGAGTSITYNPTFSKPFDFVNRVSIDLDQLVTARYVEFTPTDNYFGLGIAPGGDRVGLGEVAFEKVVSSPGTRLIFPNSVNIGETTVDRSFRVVLKNYGTQAVTINSLSLGGPDAGDFTIKSGPASLPPMSHGVVEMEFKVEGAAYREKEAALQVASTDTANPSALILITGYHTPPPDTFYDGVMVFSDTEATDLAPAFNLVQGIGFGFEDLQPHDQLPGDFSSMHWVTDAPNGAGNFFDPSPDPAALLTFDMGMDVPLSEISVWGYSVGNSNGMRDFQLSFATAAEGASGGGSIAYSPEFTVPFDVVSRHSFPFTEVVTARYVKLRPLNNWGTEGVAPGGDRVGIGEVAFQSGAVVPAPDPAFVISGVSLNAQGQMQITFPGSAAFNYTVFRSTTLGAWTPVSGNLPGIAGPMSYTDTTPVPAGTLSLFYRVGRASVPR